MEVALYRTSLGGLEGKEIATVGAGPRKKEALCYQWVFPYFMGGIVFAGLVSGAYVHPSALKGGHAEARLKVPDHFLRRWLNTLEVLLPIPFPLLLGGTNGELGTFARCV